MEPNPLYCYKSVAPIFTWGRETPTHSIMHYFQTFHAFHACNGHSLLLFAISHACYMLMVLLSVLYCLSMFIVFDVLLVHFSFAHLCCSCIMCESSKLPMFMLLLLITGSHTSKCEPITFVFSVTIVIELSCVMWQGTNLPLGKPEKRSQTSMSSTMTNFYFMKNIQE